MLHQKSASVFDGVEIDGHLRKFELGHLGGELDHQAFEHGAHDGRVEFVDDVGPATIEEVVAAAAPHHDDAMTDLE